MNLQRLPDLGSWAKTAIRLTSSKGYGLFADENIQNDTVVDVSPALIFDVSISSIAMRNKPTADRLFLWKKLASGEIILAAGLGPVSMCNHSNQPNAKILLFEQPTPRIILVSSAFIANGEEILISYRLPSQDLY